MNSVSPFGEKLIVREWTILDHYITHKGTISNQTNLREQRMGAQRLRDLC